MDSIEGAIDEEVQKIEEERKAEQILNKEEVPQNPEEEEKQSDK